MGCPLSSPVTPSKPAPPVPDHGAGGRQRTPGSHDSEASPQVASSSVSTNDAGKRDIDCPKEKECTRSICLRNSVNDDNGTKCQVCDVIWSPDCKRIATAGGPSQEVDIWDAKSGDKLLSLRGHTAHVSSVCWSPDGTRLASASHDSTVNFWDTKTGELQGTFTGHKDAVTGVAWSPDGIRLASASRDQTVRLIKTVGRKYKTLNTLKLTAPAGGCVKWTHDGLRIAAVLHDHTNRANVWDAGPGMFRVLARLTGVACLELEGHLQPVTSVSWSQLDYLATGSDDGTVRIWDATPISRGSRAVLKGHTGPVTSVAWAPDGKRVASGSLDGTIRVWSSTDGKCLSVLRGHDAGVLSISWAGSCLASGGQDETLRFWDVSV